MKPDRSNRTTSPQPRIALRKAHDADATMTLSIATLGLAAMAVLLHFLGLN